MPVWEQYEVRAETHVSILVDGKPVSQFTTYGESKGGSNETVDPHSLTSAVAVAVEKAAASADSLAEAFRLNRRRELGYRDGN